jgi:hypothetical protein
MNAKMFFVKKITYLLFVIVYFINLGAIAQTQHYLGIAACGGSPSGHAFVLWGTKDHPDSSFVFKAIGFYPKHHTWPNHFKSLIFKVPSEFLNEVNTGSLEDMHNLILVEVDTMTFKETESMIQKWKGHHFKLFTSDCVTFLQRTGEVGGLHMPSRSIFTLTPKSYVKRAVKFNKNSSNKIASCNNCCLRLSKK